MLKIKIRYHDKDLTRVEKIDIGNWIDLRVSKVKYKIGKLWVEKDLNEGEYPYSQGQEMLWDLGVAIELPKGYEALVVPRSSTYKNYRVVQTNSIGVMDNSYCGDNDKWFFPCKALYPGIVNHDDRVCQFRIIESMPEVEIEEVDSLGNKDRGGFGKTGKQ